MSTWMIAVTMICAVPWLAHAQPQVAAVSAGTPVVIMRESTLERLVSLREKLSAAMNRPKQDPQTQKLLEGAWADLQALGSMVSNAPAPLPAPQPRPTTTYPPMPEETFRALMASIQTQSFAAGQLSRLQDATHSNYFVIAQAQQLLGLYRFSPDKLKALRLLKPRLLDMDNAFKLYDSFTFASDKEEVRRILAE